MWTQWSPWSSCNVTCGGGLRHTQRTCTNPAPKFGGEECAGEDTMFDSCSEMACPSKALFNTSMGKRFIYKSLCSV